MTRKEVITAINKSITHWRENYNLALNDELMFQNLSSDKCALCSLFRFCAKCPIFRFCAKCPMLLYFKACDDFLSPWKEVRASVIGLPSGSSLETNVMNILMVLLLMREIIKTDEHFNEIFNQ